MRQTLDRVHVTQNAGSPHIRITLYDDDGELVDLSSGYSAFTARIAKRSNPDHNLLTIAGVTGTTTGFLIPAHGIAALPTTPVYILTAAAVDGQNSQPRAAQAEVVIDPSPL